MEIAVEPVGRVRSARTSLVDDFWGDLEAKIELTAAFGPEALQGLEDFSHVEVLFFLDRVTPEKIVRGARRPRNNPDWPEVGIFAQRGKNRPNRLASTVARVLRREGRTLHVAELDAVDGTPVLDLKPVIREFLPRGAVRQPDWCSDLMRRYWEREP